MIAKTHTIFNVSAAFVVLTAAGAPILIASAASGAAGVSASWPDDVEKPLRLSHRGPSHWPSVQAAVFSLPVIVCAIWLPVAAIYVAALAASVWLGCVLHSCADAMTVGPGGIKLLWPVSRRGFHLLPRFMRVWVGRDSRSEKVFVFAWCTFVLSYLYVRYHDQVAAAIAAISKHA